MKKIPTLFERIYENHKVVGITENITEGLQDVLQFGIPTVKYDGTCCAVINGELYKRYDAKKGKKPPNGAIPCCDPDPVTGHWPHWVKVTPDQKDSKWHLQAWNNLAKYVTNLSDGTYELVGPHFQGNPYNVDVDHFVKHGQAIILDLERSFEGIKNFLSHEEIQGIVFWMEGEPKCKIKRSDFGYEWPIRKE